MDNEQSQFDVILGKAEKVLEQTLFNRLVEQMVADMPESELMSKEQQYERSFSEVRKSFQTFKNSFKQAGQLLKEEHFERKGLKEEEQVQEGSIQQILGLGKDDLNGISAIAATYYEKQEYSNSRDLYLLLTTICPNESDYWFGLGSAEQMSGHYESAAMSFTMAADLNPDNPVIYLYSANCLRLLNRKQEAIAILDAIIDGLGPENVFVEVTERAAELKKEWLKAA